MSPVSNDLRPIHSSLATDPILGPLVMLYVEEMPQRAAHFRRLWQAGDFNELARAAHQMKGSAGSHGFDLLTDLAARLETALLDGQPREVIEAALDMLLEAYGRVASSPAGR